MTTLDDPRSLPLSLSSSISSSIFAGFVNTNLTPDGYRLGGCVYTDYDVALIAIASIIWSVLLSLYLSKEWVHFDTLQRAIVLTLIGVNALTSVLLYLMIVVVFCMWRELLRMLFLLAIHIAPAVLLTLFGSSFSCVIFDTKATCKAVNLAIFSVAWSITGLLLVYTLYLCVMSRVPRPFPLITPNELLDTSSLRRASSLCSVESTTYLLPRTNTTSPARPTSPASVYSYHSSHARTVPKRLFVVNAGVGLPREGPPPSTQQSIPINLGPSYSATAMQERALEPNALRSRFSLSTVESAETTLIPVEPMSPLKKLMSLRASFASAPATVHVGRLVHARYTQAHYGNFVLPHTPRPEPSQRPAGPQWNGAGYSQGYAGSPSFPGYPPPPLYLHYSGVPVSLPERTPSAASSSSSIHSLSPSIHFTDPSGSTTVVHPASLTPGMRTPNGNVNVYSPNSVTRQPNLPPTAHFRSASDPVYRSHSAGPRVNSGQAYTRNPVVRDPYAVGAEIRRHGSVPHIRGGSYGGYSESAAGYQYGYAPRSAEGSRNGGYGRGPVVGSDPRWMEAVLKAAAGRG
ncbi:hypothetical protein ONZ51_g10959 [Trametes cubensis]|uniref:Uncharacterized protein n=1 Tax=Trametes cubensis TaxID=1111947 RepID=A0AAD7X6R6_9APHY|nr:hypothetical protein ONZ51_g10959 [Trametes cubensis]